METKELVQKAQDSWVDLELILNDENGIESHIKKMWEDAMQPNLVMVIDTSNWMVHFKVVASDIYEYPKKGRIKNIGDFKTEWLELSEALERVKSWKDKGFNHQLEPNMNPFFMNALFRYIRLHRSITKGGDVRWLWCGVDDKSYSEVVLNDLILFNNELEALISLGKENTEKELQKQEKEAKGGIIGIDGNQD